MAKKSLDELVMDELDDFVGALPEHFVAAQKAAAKAAVKELQNTSPKKTGKYAKGWKSKTTKTRLGGETTIYNAEKPGLAHLLEFGHPLIAGGRSAGDVKAIPHINAAAKTANAKYEEELTKLIENDA